MAQAQGGGNLKIETLPAHLPPGNLNDLSEKNKELWSKKVSGWMEDEIEGKIEGPCDKPRTKLSQFFDGTATAFDTSQQPITAIQWTAFPKRVKNAYPDDNTRWAIADYSRMVQDEYCEWSVQRDADNNILSVTFTCEGPEYWQFIADYQEGESEGTNITKLYNDLNPSAGGISEDYLYLQNEKTGAKVYNPLNYYNCTSTTGFIAHLTQPANTLSAEIDIVAQATVVRIKNGKVITDAIDLIQCSKYGQAGRNSDPFIGIMVNNTARAKNSVSIADPVGLYMRSFNHAGFTLDDHPIGTIPGLIQWTRGDIDKKMGLRMTISIPPNYKGPNGEKRTVSDIYDTISGQNVLYAAQFTDYIQIGVSAVVIPDFPVAAAEPCPCDTPENFVPAPDVPRGGPAPGFPIPPIGVAPVRGGGKKHFRNFRIV